MQLSHSRPVASAIFDDPNLVSCAGLVPMVALAQQCDLAAVADEHLRLPTDKGANAGAKVTSLVAGMVAGADSIDHALAARPRIGTVGFQRRHARFRSASAMPMMVFGVGGRGARAERQEDFASRHPGGVPDIGWVSVGAPVEHVGQVLGGAHGLFCDPPASCGSAASGAGSKLAGAGGFGALSYSGFRASGTEWFEGLGLSGVATHPTRATLATSLLNNDAPAALVSQLLGHISDESLAHYARYNEDHMVCHLGTGAAVSRPYR